MPERGTQFWMQIIDKMNASRDVEAQIAEFLRDLCEFLGFGFGFVYRADHTGTFWLTDSYIGYVDAEPPSSITLEPEMSRQLVAAGNVSFRGDSGERTELEQTLSTRFAARSMDLIPITFIGDELMGLVGIADRRGKLRVAKDDITFTHSILSSLAMYIKSGMYLRRVKSTQQSLVSIMDNMGVDVYVNDFNTHEILYVNQSMAKPYGGVEQLIGKKCWEALYDDKTGQCEYCPQKKLIDENGDPTKLYSWDYQRPFDGSWFRVLSAAFRWVDGRLAHVVSSVDITENKRNEEFIQKMADYDQLTGLPNRRKLTQDCESLIENGKSDAAYVLFLDLDGFKKVNDTLGHTMGDELLQRIGTMFQSHPLTKNRAYRFGGDEFVILCDGTKESVRELISFLQSSFASPWQLSGGEAVCTPSVGITHFPADDHKTSELIRKADHAMYVAKNTAKGQVRFYNNGDTCAPEAYPYYQRRDH